MRKQIIKLETNTHLQIINFPDGHKHLKMIPPIEDFEGVCVSIKSFDDLFLLAQFKKLNPYCNILYINYLLGARCDRRFSDNEALDLKIITDFINSLNFKKVFILKPHSDVSLALIENSYTISVTSRLVSTCIAEQKIDLTNLSIISPDAGASKWIEKELGNTNTIPLIQCSKDRDVATGEIKGVVIPTDPKENCIIVDDLCDGGATFINIAKALKEKGAKNIYLVVTHAIFSKGLEPFEGLISKIYCTDSFTTFADSPLIYQLSV